MNPVTRTTLDSSVVATTHDVSIKVEPNGNDTWHLNFFVDMVFEDGAHLFGRANGLELSESHTEQSFGIE